MFRTTEEAREISESLDAGQESGADVRPRHRRKRPHADADDFFYYA